MALIIKKGDILNCTENILAHQCNLTGSFGGGLALQIKNKFPGMEEKLQKYVRLWTSISTSPLGNYANLKVDKFNSESLRISNCFTQNEDYTTNYGALEIVFNNLLKECKDNNWTIAVPYGYGSNIAIGSWIKVSKILENLSNKHNVPIIIYRLENQKELS